MYIVVKKEEKKGNNTVDGLFHLAYKTTISLSAKLHWPR